MPNKLPVLKTEQILRAFFKLGFRAKRKRGSHLILTKGKTWIVVPVHEGRDVPRGTLASILRQAKVSRNDFLRVL